MTTLSDMCLQREKKQQLHIPISRYEVESPYTTTAYTQFDLDMRRKAEILKYANNTSSNKTNDLTQKQKWSFFVNNKSKLKVPKTFVSFYNRDLNETYQTFYKIKTLDNGCPNTIIKTNSTAANVPGNIDLYLDESVPLYKYKKETINYGILNEAYPYNILSNYESNKFLLNGSTSNIIHLYTLKPQSDNTIVDINFPIALYINGVIKTTSLRREGNIYIPNNSINLSSFDGNLSFNNSVTSSLTANIQASNVNFDVSFNYSKETNKDFTGIIYLQNVSINNINLNSTSDYVYDIGITPVISTQNLTSLGDFDIKIGIMTNIDTNNLLIQEDCSFNSINNGSIETNSINYNSLNILSYSDNAKKNAMVVQNTSTNSVVNQLAITTSNITVENYVRCLSNFVYFDYDINNNAYNLKNTEAISLQDISKNYYVFDTYYQSNITYNLKQGVYYFVNIGKEEPIKLSRIDPSINILNNNIIIYDYGEGIQYSNYTYESYDYTYNNETYLYGSIKMTVTDRFDDISLCTYKNGSKQDVNVTFTYNDYC
jgi:hypothetical protein